MSRIITSDTDDLMTKFSKTMVFVYYKDTTMNSYLPLDSKGCVTHNLMHAAMCVDNKELRNALKAEVKENLKEGVKCSFELRSKDSSNAWFRVSWEDFDK